MHRYLLLPSLCWLFISLLVLSGCGANGAPVAGGNTSGADALSTPGSEPAYPAGESSSAQKAIVPGGMRTFIVQPSDSSASYLVDEEFFEGALEQLGIDAGEVGVIGTTGNVAGRIVIDPGSRDNPLGEAAFTADLSGLTTDQARRDRWVQQSQDGPQFSRFPMAVFVASGLSGLPQTYQEGEEFTFQMTGDLTVRDKTAPVLFDVTAVISGDTLTGTAEARVRFTDLGLTPPEILGTLRVANEFRIRANIKALSGE